MAPASTASGYPNDRSSVKIPVLKTSFAPPVVLNAILTQLAFPDSPEATHGNS